MAYDQGLAERVREQLREKLADQPAEQPDVQEKKMFGGLCFMVSGHMCCGILADKLMVRLAKAQVTAWLSEPGVRVMDFTGKPSKNMLYVLPEGTAEDTDLALWLKRCLDFVASLPPKN